MKPTQALEFVAPRDDNARLANLCGPLDENLRQIEQALDVTLSRRGHRIAIRGRGASSRSPRSRTSTTARAMRCRSTTSSSRWSKCATRPATAARTRSTCAFAATPTIRSTARRTDRRQRAGRGPAPKLYTRRADLRGRTPAQREYLKQILSHDVTFGIGPAGTGKTYLAVACAVDALERDQVKRIVLTRPAVEAGERLGFLPGDLAQKVDPYLRPLYDALYDLLGFDKTAKMFERQMIEIAPLAYMRGRTLNHAFIILDEAQNTTPEQMKMFLTRIGFGSKAVVTGDTSQVDLPRGHKSGLVEAQQVLGGVRGIALTRFTSADVVRHPLVARIVEAYDEFHAQHQDG